jgi:hypothetical protein
MKKHSEEVEAILSAGATASFEQKAIALAEIDDGKLPHLVVERWSVHSPFRNAADDGRVPRRASIAGALEGVDVRAACRRNDNMFKRGELGADP